MSPPTFQLSGGSKCVIKKLSATQNQIWQEDFLSNSLIYTEYKNAIGYVFNGFLLWLRKFRFSTSLKFSIVYFAKVIWWWTNRCVCQELSKLANSWPFYLYFLEFCFCQNVFVSLYFVVWHSFFCIFCILLSIFEV